MPVRIVNDNYGKSRVRLIKVDRSNDRHELQNMTVNIALEGDFDAIHTGRRQQPVPADGHDEKHGLCTCRTNA